MRSLCLDNSCPCESCRGARLKSESLAVTVAGKNIAKVTALTIRDAAAFFVSLPLSPREEAIARQVLKEIRERLGFLQSVGLSWTVDHPYGERPDALVLNVDPSPGTPVHVGSTVTLTVF